MDAPTSRRAVTMGGFAILPDEICHNILKLASDKIARNPNTIGRDGRTMRLLNKNAHELIMQKHVSRRELMGKFDQGVEMLGSRHRQRFQHSVAANRFGLTDCACSLMLLIDRFETFGAFGSPDRLLARMCERQIQLLVSILKLGDTVGERTHLPTGTRQRMVVQSTRDDLDKVQRKLSREVVLIGMQARHTGSIYVDEHALRYKDTNKFYTTLTMVDARIKYR